MYLLHSPNIAAWGIDISGHTASSQILLQCKQFND